MKNHKKVKSYNEGLMKVYKRKDTSVNYKKIEDLEYKYKLMFNYTSIRMEDITFAEQLETELSLKIVTQDNGVLETDYIAIINGMAYAIIHIDPDRKNGQLFFYLKESRKIEE